MPSRSVIAHRDTECKETHRVFLIIEVTERTEDGFITFLGHRVVRDTVEDKPGNCLLINRDSINSCPR